MLKQINKNENRKARHARVRKKVSGTPEKPRLNLYRSNTNIYAQIIDDTKGVTLVSASTLDKELASLESKSNKEAAKAVGLAIGKKAIEKGLAGLVRLAQFLQQPLQLFAELRFALPGVGGLAAQAVGLELRGLSRPLGLQLGGLPGLVQFQPGGLTLTRKPKVGLLTFRSHGVLHGLFQPRLGKGVVLPAKRLRLLRPGPQELVVDLVLYGVGYLKGLSAVRADDGGDVHVLAPIPSRLLTHRLICISVGLSAANIRLPL